MDIGEIKRVWQVEPLAAPEVPDPVEIPVEDPFTEAPRDDVERAAAGDRAPAEGTAPG